MMELILVVGAMFGLFAFVWWSSATARKAESAKSIGELLKEEQEANEHLKIRNDVLSSAPDDPVRRLSDKWTRPE